MRTGTIVQRGSWDRTRGEYVCAGDRGVVFAVVEECDSYGYEETVSVDVRWTNGLIETIDPRDVELIDVTPRVYVNVYTHGRAYGGPEEGGWWYDTYDPEPDYCQGPFPSEAAADDAAIKLMQGLQGENEGRRLISSVLSEGRLEVRVEAWPPEPEPSRRPHYC